MSFMNRIEGPIIEARSLTRVFKSAESEVTAVKGVDLAIYANQLISVTGRSGSGKTTLMNLMSGLDKPTFGEVLINGLALADLSEPEMIELRRNAFGFVFQSFGLIPLLSAQENVELPLHIGGVYWRERRRRASDILGLVGLGPRAKHRPYELSGGEQQRVSIARALVTNPDVVFADEPTGGLDNTTSLSIASILEDIVRQRGVTVIMATHDLTLASLADRRVDLSDGVLSEL